MKTNASQLLISGVLNDRPRTMPGHAARKMEPIRRNLSAGRNHQRPAAPASNRASIQDRTMDLVVDRLLRELTW